MNAHLASVVQEGLAVIGAGLFVFGVWQIYPPASYILSGLILAAPFTLSLAGRDK